MHRFVRFASAPAAFAMLLGGIDVATAASPPATSAPTPTSSTRDAREDRDAVEQQLGLKSLVSSEDGHQAVAPEQAISDAIRRGEPSTNGLDPLGLGRASGALWEEALGLPVFVLSELPPPETPTDEDDTGPRQETDRYAWTSGDLDGDGAPDLLALEILWEYNWHEEWEEEVWTPLAVDLVAMDGPTGTELWRTTATDDLWGLWDLLIAVVPDMDGDGRVDLIAQKLYAGWEFDSECAVIVCRWHYNFQIRWDLDVIRGASGETRWSRPYHGSINQESTSVPFVGVGRGEHHYASLVLPLPAGDLDGDGNGDIVVTTWEAQHETVLVSGVVWIEESLVEGWESRAELLGGPSGEPIEGFAPESRPYGSLLLPAGDIVGDATPDLLWLGRDCRPRCELNRGVRLEAVDGATLQATWESVAEGFTTASLTSDLDGDGHPDILIAAPEQHGVISGADGSTLWRRDTARPWGIAAIGNVDGGPGGDLLHASFGAGRLDLVRLDGMSGSTIFGSTMPDSGWTGVWLAGDVDADGVQDVAIQDLYRESFLVESGLTGAELIEAAGDWNTYFVTAGDLDGDGHDDVLRLQVQWGVRGVSLALLAGGDGHQSWTRDERFAGPFWIWLVVSATDVDGQPGKDLFWSFGQYVVSSDRVETRFEAMSGSSGATVWRVGDTFTEPTEPVDASPPTNDDIANALAVAVGDTIDQTTFGATSEDEPEPCWTGSTVWFSLVPEEDGWVSVNSFGSDFDTVLAAYDEYPSHDSLIACNDDTGGLQSELRFRIFAGHEVLIQAGGYFGETGALVLNVVESANPVLNPPANDNVADATPITLPHAGSYSTVGATNEPGEPKPCFMKNAIWFRVTVPFDGVLELNSLGSSFDTVLAVYDGTPTSESLIVCNDDIATGVVRTSELRAPVSAGDEVLIQAGGWTGETGTLRLAAALVPTA